MNCCLNFLLFAILSLTSCEGEKVSIKDAKESASKLTKEEIYKINVDIYCQTESVIKQNTWNIANPVNTYSKILGDDVKEIDCDAVLKEYVQNMYNRLMKDLKLKGAKEEELNCYLKVIMSMDYDKLRFKFNSLYGIEIENEQKTVLRRQVDKQIADVVDDAVEKCFLNEHEKDKTDLPNQKMENKKEL